MNAIKLKALVSINFISLFFLACSSGTVSGPRNDSRNNTNNPEDTIPEKTAIRYEIKSDTMEVVSDKKFVWRPLGCSPHPDSLLLINKNIFSVSDSLYYKVLKYRKSIVIIEKNALVEGSENLAEYNYSTVDEWQIRYSIIEDSVIHLSDNLMIGITKEKCINYFIGNTGIDFSRINLIRVFDPTGEEIVDELFFENGYLKKVLIRRYGD